MATREELKQEADELGIDYAKNISDAKLEEKIDEFYASKETSGPALVAVVKEKAAKEQKNENVKEQPSAALEKVIKRKAREKAARATKVVTIIDNDQRVNNHTTTCVVNCSNEYFDLGTRILPLNEKIEVAVGHIRALERVKIPLHIRDNKTGLTTVRMRPRYSISYADISTKNS